MSAGHEYVGGTHGIVSNTADMLGMSVVCEMKGVIVMCMCSGRCSR